MSYIELYRALIPENKIINDNSGQHYRIKMGKLTWLTNQFNRIRDDEAIKDPYNENINFKMPELEYIKNKIANKEFSLRCEIWRCTNRRFDPQNYATTFKAPIDLLVSNGYIPDDSWKYVNGITYVGGGSVVWNRAIRYKDDNLPKEINADYWSKNISNDFNDILIRILIEI